jgi:NitT/TauT family transport system substrate-binding protein
MNGKPKGPFYVVLLLVVGGLVAYAAYRSDILAPKAPKPDENVVIDPAKLGQGGGAESSDATAITTVKEYKIKPSEKLPPVTSVSGYKSLEQTDNTVYFALNVWAGWGPIILANEGFDAGKVWKTPDGKEFKVKLVLMDNPVEMRDAYSVGEVHIGWGTLDMVPLFLESFVDRNGEPKAGFDRVMPRIYQQVDWSNGGDGIVVRDKIKTVKDLRGQSITLAENSPSEYFLLNMLVAGGVQPSEVTLRVTDTAFEAATAFASEPSLAAAVSWAPDIYKLADVKGNRLLVSTQDANKLIADIWFARADFAKDQPGIIEALVRGIFDAMQELKKPEQKQRCAGFMEKGYNIPAAEIMNMFGDAHSTNWAENYQFFLNQNNPARFEAVWNQAYYLYGVRRKITHRPVSFDKVMDFRVIQKLGQEAKYSSQKDEYRTTLPTRSVAQIKAENEEILTNTIVVHFAANNANPFFRFMQEQPDGAKIEAMADPNVDNVLKEAARLAAQFSRARVVVEGHADSSNRGKPGIESLVKQLSDERAHAIRDALVKKFQLEPNRFEAIGMGFDVPADPNDPDNHAKNRRVEIKIYSAEKE